MRILALGGLAALCIAGCGDNKADSKTVEGPLDSLKIEDTKVGTGPAAKDGDTVFVEYTGKLADGTEFDSTAKHDNAPFQVVIGAGKVIPGWDKGLVGMKEGGERKLSIPANQAYGEKGQGTIPPNADIFFTIKLDKLLAPGDMDTILINNVTEGSGPGLKDGDTASLQYVGKFLNGKEFDSTKAHGGAPFEVTLGEHKVVVGFEEGLRGMKAGGERVITIPPQYGYGQQSPPGMPPNSWLIFDLKLESVKAGGKK